MASILETFVILFKTDAEDVEKGAKKAGKSMDTLEKSISSADELATDLGANFTKLATRSVAAFASVFAVTKLMSGSKAAADQSTELGVLSRTLGESASEIVNWGRAVQNVGGDAEAFRGSLVGLNQSLSESLIAGANNTTEAFNRVGVKAFDANGNLKTTLQILPELAKAFGAMPRTEAISAGGQLGLDVGTVLLLRQGADTVKLLVDRQRELNLVTDEDRVKLAMLNIRWIEFGNLMSDVGARILVFLIPALESIEKGFIDLGRVVLENQDPIMTFLTGMGVILGALAIKALILAAPFLLTAAAVAAVAFGIGLLVEDIVAFANGQDSVIGRIEKRWGIFKTIVDAVSTAFENVETAVDGIKESVNNLDIRGFFDSIRGVGGDLFEGLERGKDFLSSAQNAGLSALNSFSVAAGAGPISRSVAVTVGGVTIETNATDAAGIAAELSREMSTQLKTAVDTFDDGVAG